MTKSGQIWVDGSYFHYIDDYGVERQQEGTVDGATGAKTGYIWLEENYLHYIDQTGTERRIALSAIGGDDPGGHTTGFPYIFTFFFDGEGT
jgi:hypothetical protein